MKREFKTTSDEETLGIGFQLGKQLNRGSVVCVTGDLGAGKTVFTKGIAKALGVKENVTSPTYVLIKKYKIAKKKSKPSKNVVVKNFQFPTSNFQFFYHMDAYRLSDPQEALDLGIEEIWSDPNNIIAIEWAEKISDILPKNKVDLCFESISENERKIMIFD